MWGLINQDHKSYLTQPVETTTLSNSPLTGILTGITQERINEMRAAPEQVMICDIHDILATGQDLNRTDAQGATLVSETAAASVLLSFSPQVMKPALEQELHKVNMCKSLRGDIPQSRTHLLTCRELDLGDLPVTSCFSLSPVD